MRNERLRPQALTTRPTVSVVIPCYNYGRFLPEAVNSVLRQADVDVDVIVVDDCSTDDSLQVARRLGGQNPQTVRVVAHERNLGHIATYNDGLSRVRGDYVVLLSADDVLADGALGRACALAEARPDVGLVYGYAADFEDTPPAPRTRPTSWTVWPGLAWAERACARGANIIVNPEAMLRRDLLDELGGYDPDLPHAADMALWLRAATRANVGRVNGVDQAFYRVHGANMHLTTQAGLLVDLTERRRVFTGVLAPDPAMPHAARLRERALRTLSLEAVRHASNALDHDRTAGGCAAAAFADFAVETWPGVRSSARWRGHVSRRGRPAGSVRRVVAAKADQLSWKLRWRRWRRFGT